MNRYRFSLLAGVLSILCFVVGLCLLSTSLKQDNLLCDILLDSSFPLCIAAGVLGTKRWWWLLLAYAILCFLIIISNLSFSF
jgi:hypothetical protein